MYRVRFEVDTISLEQDRIRDLFQKYQSLKSVNSERMCPEDLLTDFIDFILYYTTLAQRKYGAIFVEFFLKMIKGKGPKIFIQFQKSIQPSLSQSSPSPSHVTIIITLFSS